MKKKIVLGVFMSIFTFTGVLFLSSETAQAAAICYTGSLNADETTEEFFQPFASVEDCGDERFGPIITLYLHLQGNPDIDVFAPPDLSLLEDGCYYFGYGEYINIPTFAAPDSVACANLATNATASADIPAKCFTAPSEDFEFRDVNDLTEVPCTQALADIVGSELNSSQCYVFSPDQSALLDSRGCNQLVDLQITDLTIPESGSSGFTPITEDERKELNECPGPGETIEDCLNKNPIVNLIKNAINFFSAGVGIVVVGVIILAGIQYSTAGANPNSTAAAKGRIVNAVVALLMYILLFAFIQWLIPGGIFS